MMGKDASMAADILRMKSDSIPLFTAKTLASARVSSTPASVESSVQAATSIQNSSQPAQAEAKVVASKLQPQPENSAHSKASTKPEWQLTLEVDGKTLKVNSRLPLPVDSRVTVTVSQDANGKPQLNVDAIELAPTKAPVPSKTADTLANSAETRPASNPTTSLLQVLKGAVSSKAPVPSAVVSQWLASRLPAATQAQVMPATLKMLTSGLNQANNPVASSATNTNSMPSASSAINALLAQQLPESVRQSLNQFIAAQPERPGLNQGSQVESAVRNSPQQYERQLLQHVVQKLLPNAELPSAIKNSSPPSLFQQLWRNSPSAPLANSGPPLPSTSAVPNSMNMETSINGLSLRQGLRQIFSPTSTDTSQGNKQLRTLSDAIAILLNRGQSTDTAKNTTPASTAALATESAAKSLINAGHIPLSDDQALAKLLTHNLKGALAKAFVDWQGQLSGGRGAMTSNLPLSFSAPADDVPDAFRLLQSTLAQHEVEQFRMVQSSSEQLQTSLALLYRDGNQLRDIPMRMQREDEGEGNQDNEMKRQSRWRIKLHFNLTELGPLDVDLDLRMPTMSATFWSQQPDTLARINQAIAPLRQRLTELGVNVESLQAKHGQLPPQEHGNIQHSLVDIHT
ncbi:flagellar hook-length control protein FliK [Thalassolituus sp.]|jgi:hypothetical protein|uniref:flagellar hook-length control protein FliK n=1 Tax=Thalassolituus sp. TaxID=2030822 RepID=UPI002A83778B|nr:flagellar hook-length control protein FliK [Thalassolituus sp.]